MNALVTALESANIGAIRYNEPLSSHTTWKIGGPADIMITPSNAAELQEAIRLMHEHGIPWTKIGRGSNMLVSDKGIRGAVIKLGSGFNEIQVDGATIVAGAAYSFIKLAVMAAKAGLTGLEFAGGIPGTVGGAVYMNAGSHGSDVSRIFESAAIVLETGELVHYSAEEMAFRYRHSALHACSGIVVSATFKLAYGEREQIDAAMAALKQRRLLTQPLQLATAGSVFRNPEGDYAARLIQEAGLKGLRYGGAQVSELHANFIVNTGQATADDVLALMAQIQEIVFERFGIRLQPEVLVVGER